ncbi:MAG: radical SAM protein [Myxococcota bacterium]
MIASYTRALLRLTDRDGDRWIPRPKADVLAALDAITEPFVRIGGGEPTLSPHLITALRAAKRRNLRAELITDGRALTAKRRLDAMADAGVSLIHLRILGATDETHDRLRGLDGGLRRLKRALALINHHDRLTAQLHFELHGDALDEAERVLRIMCALPRRDATLEIRRDVPDRAVLSITAQAIEIFAEADRHLSVIGVSHVRPTIGEPTAITLTILKTQAAGIPVPDALAGVYAGATPPTTVDLIEVGLRSAARGAPILDLPPCAGGQAADPTVAREPTDACQPCPARATCGGVPSALKPRLPVSPRPHWSPLRDTPTIAVINIHTGDFLRQRWALPALATALKAMGASVSTPFSPRTRAQDARAQLSKLDLTEMDMVLTSDPAAAQALLDAGRLGRHTQLVALDFHMLTGVPELIINGQWPDPRLRLVSCFPSYGHLYTRFGVPAGPISFRPYPMPEAPTRRGQRAVAAGNHNRAWSVLEDAARTLGQTRHPIDVYTAVNVQNVGPIRNRGELEVSRFVQTVQDARYVIIPLKPDRHKASGISVAAIAFAAGRPIVATWTPGMRDHCRDGVDAILVRPDDPDALAEAIAQLDQDDDLLRRLEEGALAARARQSTTQWARDLLYGAPPQTVFTAPGQNGPPWFAW